MTSAADLIDEWAWFEAAIAHLLNPGYLALALWRAATSAERFPIVPP